MRVLKRLLASGFLIAASCPVFAADVGVSISVGQPGFYGRIDIGDYPYPQPRVIYSRPIVVQRQVEVYEPLYLRVPPGHAKNWKRYCGRYEACGYPVYFVRDSWYQNDYVPYYRERHGDDYRDRGDHDRGHGNKNGHNKGRGKH
jgi:hypothetical protein